MKKLLSFALLTVTALIYLSGISGCASSLGSGDQNSPNATSYRVTFDGQGATTEASPSIITVTFPDTTVGTLPVPPLKTGYLFGGWYTETNGGGTEFTAATAVTNDMTVYAKWTNYSYSVIFDSQGATVPASPTNKTVNSPATTVVTLPTAPTKVSNNFAGWYTATNGGGIQFTASTVVTDNMTVYAYWTTNQIFTVTYNSDGGSAVSPQLVIAGSNVGTLPADPTKTGYIFGGWYTGLNGTGTSFYASTSVTSNTTVYAKWNSYNYTVTYDSQGGSSVDPTSVVSPATTVGVLPSNPTKTGYTFNGWFTQTNGNGSQFLAGTTVTGNITVYAYWIANAYTVLFDSQGATVAASPTNKTVTYPATTVDALPIDPAKTGYTFGGWFTQTNGGGTQFYSNTTVSANITVYAKWTAISYVVLFDSQGATVAASPTNKTVTYPATNVGTLPTAPTKTGYIFGGWFTQTNGGGTQFYSNTTVTANITVYAYWIANVYTVLFDSQGATVAASPTNKTVTYPATNVGTLPTDPAKTGYIFGGWFTQTNGGGSQFYSNTTVSANITVYAKWTAVSYTVTFDSQSATVPASPSSKTVTYPATNVGTLPTDPSRLGYHFSGWFTATSGGGTSFTASTTVTNSLTVYAYWTLTNIPAQGPTYGIFSETVSNIVLFDIDTVVSIWNGMTMTDDTTTYSDGTKSWKLTGTGAWMGMGITVNPTTNYKDMSVFTGGSFRFSFKGQKSFKLGLKSGAGTESWLYPGQLMDYGLTTNNSWCNVSIPLSAFNGLNLGQLSQYFMFTADGSTGYQTGDVFNIDNMYYTTNATAAGPSRFSLYTESYPVNVTWDTDGKMEVWNNGVVLSDDTSTSGEGATSLKITANPPGSDTWNWGALSLRVNPLTAYKDMSAFSSGNLVFMFKSSHSFEKVGVIDSANSAGVWVTGATCIASYGMKTNDTWCKVTIPLSAFPGVNWSSLANYFVLVVSQSSGFYAAGYTWNVDNIYFQN